MSTFSRALQILLRSLNKISFTKISKKQLRELLKWTPNDVNLKKKVLDNILKLEQFSNDNELCEDYPTTRNRLAEEARAEMMRDGCCQGGLRGRHADVNRKLGAADAQHQRFRAGGVRLATVEGELDRLYMMLRPIRRYAKYSCFRCEEAALEAAVPDLATEASREAGRAFCTGVATWDHLPAPKRPYHEWVANPEQHELERQVKWARLSPAQRAAHWNPIPGAFMLVQPQRAD